MYLKRMEIVGFKSFAEKTKLNFGKGISLIVGPNGCGKSNVLDAIKWVLGEQSAKSLRSKQMTDVIFNGTQNRTALGLAEVSLIFDNVQNVLPIDFSEVVITRKIFRSGESEYSINKSPCRLKDVRDLFADTGIGADGYSIIEQGRVEFIINSRAEERRELFEEAAGISKYKIRKEEALRKLERIRQDINRINDIIAIHQEQVKSLEAAARKSRQYQKLKEELRRSEITQIIYAVDESRKKLEILQGELSPLTEEKQLCTTEIDSILVEIEKIKNDTIEIDSSIVARQDEAHKLNTRIEIADSKISQSDAVSRTAQEKIKSRGEDIQKDSEEITKHAQREQELLNQLSLLELSANEVTLRHEKAASVYRVVEEKFRSLIVEADGIKAELWSIVPMVLEKSNLKTKLESDIEHFELKLGKLHTETEANLSELNEARHKTELKNSEAGKIKIEIEELETASASTQKKLDDSEEHISALKNALSAAKQTISILAGELNALGQFEDSDPILSSIRSVLNAGLKLRGPVIELVKLDTNQSGAPQLGSIFAEKAYFMIAPDENCAKQAVDFLINNNLTALTFVIESRISEPQVTSELMGILEVAQENRKVLNYLLSSTRIEGSTVADGALLRGGAKSPVFAADVLVQRRQKEEKLASERARVTSLENEHNELISRHGKLEGDLAEAKKFSAEKEFTLKWHQNEINQLGGLINEKVKLQEVLLGELKNNTEEIVATKEKMQGLDSEILQLRKSETHLKNRLNELSNEINAARPEEEERRKEAEEVRIEVINITPKVEALRNQIELLKTRISYLDENIKNNTKEIEGWKFDIESHNTSKTEQRELITSAQNEKKNVQDALEVLIKARDERKNILSGFESRDIALSSKKEELLEKIHKLDLEIKTFNVEINAYINRLKDEFDASEEIARQQLLDSLLDIEELSKLRKKIEQLGSVNLAAPEEYDALNKKYEFIMSQRNDLQKAHDDLEEIIKKINSTTKEQFKDTWEKVRDNFKNIFGKLFEGGQADLLLTDPENILESGVEIFAQPPGKKLQSITLLSGGEKAMTAVALLFAFYLVRPAPFCILDEIDAPLDESNVERFLNLLETFTENSQFLIITHNKRTMLRGDVIYGVTMEEFGVSKIISMKLEDASEAAAV